MSYDITHNKEQEHYACTFQPAELLEKVKVERIKPSEGTHASSYNDYSITVEELPSSLSEKVKVTVLNLA